jgi:hypothetical protein
MAKTVVLKKAVRPTSHVAPLRATKKAEDPTVMTWRALAPLRVADEGADTTHLRQFGDFVPEAGKWRNLNTYLKTQQLEIAYVNQSELDAWRDMYAERIAEEDEALAEAKAVEEERLALMKRLRELDKQDAEKKKSEPVPANSHQTFEDGKTLQEKIDFGGIKKKGPGIPAPVELPKVTREVPVQRNVGENRTRQPSTSRVLRKKA